MKVHMRSIHKKITLRLSLLGVVLGLAACGNKDVEKPASQIAVKATSGEISVHQLNNLWPRPGASPAQPEAAQKIRRETLNKLVDQELAVEQALEKSLTGR